MFISPPKPQRKDVVSLRDNVFTFAAAEFAPWLFQLNQINAAFVLHQQQRLHDMSYNNMALKGGWSQPGHGLKQPPPQHGLPVSGSGFYPESAGNGLPTAEGQSTSSNRTSRSSTSSYVSHYPSVANVLAAPELLDSPYWHVVPPGPTALPPFAPNGDPAWEHSQCFNSPLVDYGQYNLGVHASVLPQTVFRPGTEALHDLSLASMAGDRDSSTSSKLYASSDMMEAMALDDNPSTSSWNSSSRTHTSSYGRRCVEIPESDVTSSSWADPSAPADGGKTVSPNMLRIRPTQSPSPASSCESLHTSFMGDNQPLAVVEPIPSQAGTGKTSTTSTNKKTRRQLPDRSRRHPSVTPNPPSPTTRKLTRLRPKPKHPSPSPSNAPFTVGGPSSSSGSSSKERGVPVVDLPDRVSKDDFLVRQKQLGMTYKEIRRMGGFTEAESTLRGRYRTLTKCREARVRKPEWSEKDLHLLEKAVRTLSLAPDNLTNTSKIPWKKVAEYIVAHGGSYHFGNSTCRKRWDDLVREMADRGKGLSSREWFFSSGGITGGEGMGMGVGEYQGYL